MLVLTGRLAAELPAQVVRGLMWRIFATRAAPLIAGARAPLPDGASLQAKVDHADLIETASRLERLLSPEDDDDA